MFCSTFHNTLFEKKYPDIYFITPGIFPYVFENVNSNNTVSTSTENIFVVKHINREQKLPP